MEFNKNYSGKEFKELFPEIKLYKLLKKNNMKYEDYKFKIGENVEPSSFTAEIRRKGCEFGFHLLEPKYIFKFVSHEFMFATVEIQDDSIIYIKAETYKVNKFIITDIMNMTDFINLPEMIQPACQYYDRALEFIRPQTEEICKLAVRYGGERLKLVKNQTDEICRIAVENDGNSLKHVKRQTEEICRIAVKHDGEALKYVRKQNEELCKVAVQQSGYALKYVKIQTDEICKIAVQYGDDNTLKYVKIQTTEICKLAIEANKESLKHVRQMTEDIADFSLVKFGSLLKLMIFMRRMGSDESEDESDEDESSIE